MRVLIIGGTGNISAAIAAQLIGRGDQVVLYNRGQTKPQFEGKYQTITGDRRDHARFEAQMQQAGVFDAAIDMIGYEPADAHSGVRAFAGRVGRLVFCSTVDVYTKAGSGYPLREDAERLPSPAFPYAHKKAQMERIFERAQEEGGFPLTIIRPAATYNDSWAPIPLVGKGRWSCSGCGEGCPSSCWGMVPRCGCPATATRWPGPLSPPSTIRLPPGVRTMWPARSG
jgi:nucleoside-diphosphate-sugar epimerase